MKATIRLAPILFTALSLASSPVKSEEKPNLLLDGGTNAVIFNIDTFSIEYSDQVTDGCLNSPIKLSDAMEVSLRQAGFQIDNEGSYGATVYITVLGYKVHGVCVVSQSVDLEFLRVINVPFSGGQETFALYTLEVDNRVMSGDAAYTQKNLEDIARRTGDKIYLMISRAKDHMRENHPDIYDNYIKNLDAD